MRILLIFGQLFKNCSGGTLQPIMAFLSLKQWVTLYTAYNGTLLLYPASSKWAPREKSKEIGASTVTANLFQTFFSYRTLPFLHRHFSMICA